MSLPPGTVVAGYRIERVLGAGGMGTVYLAHHPSLQRRDAVKVLSAELSHDAQFRTRFLREAELAATLDHPNIVTVYDRGETPAGQLWIAMQFVDGTDAGAEVADTRMTVRRAVHIVTEVAKALDYAHSRKLLHRDVKPANFLLAGPAGPRERVLLADFGIARALDDATGLTATGTVVATASYAAPETLEGQRVDHRADVYSLGCSLFRLLTGRTPYAEFGGMSATLMAHLLQPIPRATQFAPWLPPAIDDVFLRALAKAPEQRFQSAGELAAAAAAVLSGQSQTSAPSQTATTREWQTPPPPNRLPPPPTMPPGPPLPVHGPPPSWAAPPPRRRARRWWALGGAATVAVAVVVAVAMSTTNADHPATTPRPTTTAPPAVASANDTGPVSIITDDPTCVPWRTIAQEWTVNGPLSKWPPESPDSPINIPASAWTTEQRAAMQQVEKIMRSIAAKSVALARATPHRVLRELYEQYIAYARAYADSFTNYFPQADVKLGKAAEAAMNSLISACNAVADGDAAVRAGLVAPRAAPTRVATPQNAEQPQRFIAVADRTTCGEWESVSDKFDADPSIQEWSKFDIDVPIAQWSPRQKELSGAVTPVMLNMGDDLDRIAGRSNNPVIQDFAAFAAQYQRTYVKTLPNYNNHDGQLGAVGKASRQLVSLACGAVGA
jgi:serine/threonine protein kinase